MLGSLLLPLRGSNLMTNLTVLTGLVLVRKMTVVLPLLGLVLLVLSQEYRVLLVLLYGVPFLLMLLQQGR